MRIGIIGYGDFGQLLAKHISGHAEIGVYSRRPTTVPTNITVCDLSTIATYDYIILAIPLSAYPAVLDALKPHWQPTATLVDVCSVKSRPQQLLQQHLPQAKRLLTHPLFGPQSAANGLQGHTIIICPEDNKPFDPQFMGILEALGLEITSMSPNQHDQLMAKLQALTFFVGRALANTGVGDLPIVTPSYKKLLALTDLDANQTEELFQTVEQGNPHAAAIRQKFLRTAQELHAKIENETISSLQ